MIDYGEQRKEQVMNNYRNYGNYGNRRYAGNNDCGCMKPEVKPGMDCGCMKPEVKPGTDCGCMKPEVKPGMDCGCMKPEEKKEHDCGCTVESMYREVKKNGVCCEEDMPGKALAMAYVPWQTWRNLYEVCEGFSTGTIFKELDLEFYGRRCN